MSQSGGQRNSCGLNLGRSGHHADRNVALPPRALLGCVRWLPEGAGSRRADWSSQRARFRCCACLASGHEGQRCAGCHAHLGLQQEEDHPPAGLVEILRHAEVRSERVPHSTSPPPPRAPGREHSCRCITTVHCTDVAGHVPRVRASNGTRITSRSRRAPPSGLVSLHCARPPLRTPCMRRAQIPSR